MPNSTRTLGEICDEVEGVIRTGPFGSQLHQDDYSAEGVPVVMPKNIVNGQISTADIARVNDGHAERLIKHQLRAGDIVYGRRGDIGRRALITNREEGWLCGTGCLRLSLGDQVLDPHFLYYFLGQQTVSKWILNQAIGATLPNLNTTIIRRVPISFPEIQTQRDIASILSAYDDLIENNTRRIRILEETAQSLYREWFVHFRFPGHEKVKLVDSPLGKIPKSWEVVKFTDMAEVLSGGTPKTTNESFWGGDILFFTPKDAASSFFVTESEKTITKLGLSKCSSKLYPKDTVFITARGTVGKVVMPAIEMAMNQSCYALVGKDGISQLFLFFLTRQSTDLLKKNTGGATFDTIIVDTFKRFNVLKPETELISLFTQQVKPIFQSIRNLLYRNINLRKTVVLLLPSLLSGKIEVGKKE